MPPVIQMPAKPNISWTVAHGKDTEGLLPSVSHLLSTPTTLLSQIDRLFIFSLKYRSATAFQTTGPVRHEPMCLFHSSPIWGSSSLGRSHSRRAESHTDLRSVWTQLLHLLWQGESPLPILLEVAPFNSKAEEPIQDPCVFGEHYICDASDVVYMRLMKWIFMCSAEEINVRFES